MTYRADTRDFGHLNDADLQKEILRKLTEKSAIGVSQRRRRSDAERQARDDALESMFDNMPV
tara:strand:+ start:655 stop:840 length:186 start_codon:yes stop_codon:yes gene_type:complete